MPDDCKCVDVRWSLPADLASAVRTVAETYGVPDDTAAAVLLTLALSMSRAATAADLALHEAAKMIAEQAAGATKH